MSQAIRVAIFGCGDFLRWQAPALQNSHRVTVRALYDPDQGRARQWAEKLGGEVVAAPDDVFSRKDLDAVLLFVPPWVRKPLLEKAAERGWPVITTKPLAAQFREAEMAAECIEKAGLRAGVLYSRSGDVWTEGVKALLADGRYGRLALYKQDWLHHYPEWNNWALDPAKNGGPFMDAMIHNLNAARYLMGRPVASVQGWSDRFAHPALSCADTEFMLAQFETGGAAHLFITWAADLEVRSKEGNDREHIDQFFLVTEGGWLLTKVWQDGQPKIRATRDGQVEWNPPAALDGSVYDRFFEAVESGTPNPGDLPTIREAARDIQLIESAFPRRA